MFTLFRPSSSAIARFLAAQSSARLSYERVGMAAGNAPGFTVDETTLVIGHGDRDFDRACAALASWTHFKLGWVEIFPSNAPAEVGINVAVRIKHLGLWSLNGSRVVYTLSDEVGRRRFGFAYGTLRSHAERGEELFDVTLDPRSGAVTYRIRAVSRPRAILAWLGYPVVRRLQEKCRRESAEAMRRAVAG